MKTKEFMIFYLSIFQIEGLTRTEQILLAYIYSRQKIGTPKNQTKLGQKFNRKQEAVSVNLFKLADKGYIIYNEDRIYPSAKAVKEINPNWWNEAEDWTK